ncbi:MAG: AAA family ATPase, partial [Clostridia bacterium]|nr:AAA family ATPase [Clostridia bacterium]
MLLKLSIRNAALIEQAELSFSGGLNVLSGETGAGKSVILDCIDFVLGAKADRTLIRFGAEECLVRAEFTPSGAVNEVLTELDIEPDETLILSRKLSIDGKGSMKINGVTVTAAMLRRVTSLLVDIHGQSEHFFLLKESNQLHLLDSVGGAPIAQKKEKMQELLAQRKEILRELELLGGDEGERSRRLDILRYQIDEIKRADLKEGEEEELTIFRNRFQNAEKILSALSTARDYLLAESGSIDTLNGARRGL